MHIYLSSGCEGNLNNFQTVQECEKMCELLIDMSRQASGLLMCKNRLLKILFSIQIN